MRPWMRSTSDILLRFFSPMQSNLTTPLGVLMYLSGVTLLTDDAGKFGISPLDNISITGAA